MTDVKSKKCIDCDKLPLYNYETEKKALYCFTHKKENMIDVKNKRCLDCNKQPHFKTIKMKRKHYIVLRIKKTE